MSNKQASKKVRQLYIEPIGQYTYNAFSDMLRGVESSMFKGADGEEHNLFSITESQLEHSEDSRRTDTRLRFALWEKDKFGEFKLRKSDRAYRVRSPSFNRGLRRKLEGTLTNGLGKPVPFPCKRKSSASPFKPTSRFDA